MEQVIYSTGIDIGTSTTHLIVSKLTVTVKEGFGCAPKVEIGKKEILYMSKIYFTPLDDDGKISARGVKQIIDFEYKNANISPEILKSGAVIITGESAKKRNAKELLFEISKYAGDFIVAEAGGETESVLAGKGVGGMQLSANEMCGVCTVDIGGGTTNIAYFLNGSAKKASCIDVGGRLIKLDGNNIVSDISNTIKPLLLQNNIDLQIGDVLTKSTASKIVFALWKNILLELKNYPPADKYIFSGGVSDCIGKNYGDYSFNDLGVLLSREIEYSKFFRENNCVAAENSIRATVIGAGNFSFEISGSTISNFNFKLPVKNIPCIKINVNCKDGINTAANGLNVEFLRHPQNKPVAVAFNGYSGITANEMICLAKQIVNNAQPLIKNNLPIIVLIDKDIGKAFGVCLKKYLPENYPVLCIDCVNANDNDYLDIGESVGGGRAVPVSVKQLVFSV